MGQEQENKLKLQGEYTKTLNHPVSSPLKVLKEISGAVDEIAVTLNRSRGQQLGAEVKSDEDGKTVLIEFVHDGVLKEWNAANASKQIQAGNRIVSVNGIRYDADRMIDELSTNQ